MLLMATATVVVTPKQRDVLGDESYKLQLGDGVNEIIARMHLATIREQLDNPDQTEYISAVVVSLAPQTAGGVEPKEDPMHAARVEYRALNRAGVMQRFRCVAIFEPQLGAIMFGRLTSLNHDPPLLGVDFGDQ